MYPKRPSDHELFKRIEEAKCFLDKHNGLFANPAKAVGELYALNIAETSDLWLLIRELLQEIEPKDYSGGRPPQKSYEQQIANQELLAFSWFSNILKKEMYIKFALKQSRFYYVSLHTSALKEQKG
jgi:hypothetical protein